MKIETGLLDHMIVQRNRHQVSEADFSGTSAARGPVRATVRLNRRVVKGFADRQVGRAARGRVRGTLKGLPVGGPYDIDLRAGDEQLTIRDVLVGDVWLLGGQSNMQGCGLIPRERLPVDPLVRAFYMDDRWAPADDPIHNMWMCVDPVHNALNNGNPHAKPAADWGVCPGPAFGIDMRQRTGVPQGLIACAHGGTSMAQWDPARKREGGNSLYGAMVRRLQKNGRRVAGLLWYQGCSDANVTVAPLYTKRMKTLVAAVRRDAGDTTLPIAIVQIARVIGWGPDSAPPWNSIQDQQRRLPLDDGIHISGGGQYVLGRRLAQAMQNLRGDRQAGPPPIAFKKVTLETVRNLCVVNVEYANVVGRLRSGDRPHGFTLAATGGTANHFDLVLDGSCVRVRSNLPASSITDASLHYGYGTDPYCNITDEAGRSLPVLGPIPLGEPRAVTPYIRTLRVSAYQPSVGTLHHLDRPPALDGLGMVRRSFPQDFCDLHAEIGTRGGCDEVVYFACRFACDEAMSLALLLGYDGPARVWLDGKALFHDPKGTNPASPEKGVIPFEATAGEHEILVALATNHGAAWGIYLRLERKHLSRQMLHAVPPRYVMPRLLE